VQRLSWLQILGNGALAAAIVLIADVTATSLNRTDRWVTTSSAGEYDNMCTMGLAMGKDIQTDCSINGVIGGKTYCFGSEEAKTEFMKAPEANLAKAQAYYSKKHPG
jgi:YHS domain-containing protein